MTSQALFEELRDLGVFLEAEGDHLYVDAPAGVVTEGLKVTLVEHKQGLIKLLEQDKQRKRQESDCRGLLIRWLEYPKWIEIHDPLSGELHEVTASECLPSVVEAADRHRNRKL